MKSTIHFKYYKCFLVGFSLLLLGVFGCRSISSKPKEAESDSSNNIYTCSMHPQIIEHQPGNCPICGMKLVKKENAAREISKIDLSTLLQPVNEVVLSSIPVTTMQNSRQEINMAALGSLEYDTRFVKTIAARVGGRIEKLYVKYRYQIVHAGEQIMDIYSPELFTGEQNLLFLSKNDPGNTMLINAAKQKLLLLGITESQIETLMRTGEVRASITLYSNFTGIVQEAGNKMNSLQPVTTTNETTELSIKEGMYLERGQPVFQVNNLNNLWARLNIFPGDEALVKVGTKVIIIPETDPGKKILSRISFLEPFYRDNSKTISARVYFNNSKLKLPVGSQVTATLMMTTPFSNWLPDEAVLTLGLTKIVFLKEGDVFKAHPVSTGYAANNLVQITAGLTKKDSVAANAQFLVDSEGFIKVKQ